MLLLLCFRQTNDKFRNIVTQIWLGTVFKTALRMCYFSSRHLPTMKYLELQKYNHLSLFDDQLFFFFSFFNNVSVGWVWVRVLRWAPHTGWWMRLPPVGDSACNQDWACNHLPFTILQETKPLAPMLEGRGTFECVLEIFSNPMPRRICLWQVLEARLSTSTNCWVSAIPPCAALKQGRLYTYFDTCVAGKQAAFHAS